MACVQSFVVPPDPLKVGEEIINEIIESEVNEDE